MRMTTALVAISAILSISDAHAQTTKDDRLNDVVYLFGTSLAVIGTAGYSEKFITKDNEVPAAARRWNDRHAKTLNAIAKEFKEQVSDSEKKAIDDLVNKELKNDIEAQSDKVRYCRHYAKDLDARHLDFDNSPDAQEVLSGLGISAKYMEPRDSKLTGVRRGASRS